ncbi:MAG TPA: universal stress protein [Desulfotignum sp.]|jgi:universal stress protein E|nr:universal stress protein [Desulfotignum sp.]
MKRFKNILYVSETGVDQTPAMTRAVSLAKNNQADLTVVDVIPEGVLGDAAGLLPDSRTAGEVTAGVIMDRRRALASLISPFTQNPDIRIQVVTGTLFLEVIRMVLSQSFDLVIKPAEDPDWMDRLFGSDDMHLLRKCPCPVWLMKPGEKSRFNTVLAAVDIDPVHPVPTSPNLNRTILELAGSIALADKASLHLAHAWDASAEQTFLSHRGIAAESVDTYVQKKQAVHTDGLSALGSALETWIGPDAGKPVAPRLHLIQGPAKKMIPQLAHDLSADLVVMGTIARTGVSGLFIGNTAEAVFHQLKCSILAVKPPGFESPVKPG